MASSKNAAVHRAARSGLSREFSFRYPSHKVIATLAVSIGLLAGLLRLAAGEGLGAAFLSGLNSGAAAFVAWVLARELDPPRQWTAWLAAALAGLVAVAWRSLPLAHSMLFILLLRLVNRSAGVRFGRADRLVVLGAAALVLLWTGNGWLGIAATLAFLLDAAFADRTENLAFAALAGLATLLTLLIWNQRFWPFFFWPALPVQILSGLTAALFLFWLFRLPRRALGPDDRGDDFNGHRLRAALLLALVSCLLAAFTGPNGWFGITPLWAALLAALIPG